MTARGIEAVGAEGNELDWMVRGREGVKGEMDWW